MPEEKKKQPLWKVYGLVLCCSCFLLFDLFAGWYRSAVRACCPPRIADGEPEPVPVAEVETGEPSAMYASAERPLLACASMNV